MLNVIMLSVFMLNVVMQCVFRLSILAPLLGLRPDSLKSNETGLKLNYQSLILAPRHLVEAPIHQMSPFQPNNIR